MTSRALAGKGMIPKHGILRTFMLQQWEGSSPIYPKTKTPQIKFLKTEMKKSELTYSPARQFIIPPLLLQKIAQQKHKNTH